MSKQTRGEVTRCGIGAGGVLLDLCWVICGRVWRMAGDFGFYIAHANGPAAQTLRGRAP